MPRDWLFRRPTAAPRAALPVLPFKLSVDPPPLMLGAMFEQHTTRATVFRFSFGNLTASHRVENAWRACCDLYLQAQLINKCQLYSVRLQGERLFNTTYVNHAIVCSWSRDHTFAVKRADVVRSFEAVVEEALSATSGERREEFIQLGASIIQNDERFVQLKDRELASAN